MAENHGVFESGNVYNHVAIARILGVADTVRGCSQFVLNKMLKEGLPFARVGKQYLVSGLLLNEWIREHSKTWEEHFPTEARTTRRNKPE